MSVDEYKPYREKEFSNSDDEPFGITLKGKTKGFVSEHQAMREIMIKGKSLRVQRKSIKFLDVDRSSRMVNAIIEVSDANKERGQVEMKVYIPSKIKVKTLTKELRKLTGYDFLHVKILKDILSILLDGFINGKSLDDIIDNGRRNLFNRPLLAMKEEIYLQGWVAFFEATIWSSLG